MRHHGTRLIAVGAIALTLCLAAGPLTAQENREQQAGGRNLSVEEPEWTGHFYEGRLGEAEQTLLAELRDDPDDDQARFGLAVARLLQSVEGLMQAAHRFGLEPGGGLGLPMMGARLPVPSNPDPQEVTYEMVRTQIKAWLSDLEGVQRTLTEIDSENVKLPLRFGMIRLDFDGDGNATEQEVFWRIYTQLNRRAAVRPAQPPSSQELRRTAERFTIVFDAADVQWLRGYCHLLMAAGEIALAHDWEELFHRAGHLLFARPDTPYEFLLRSDEGEGRRPFDFARIVDFIAAIHLIDLPVTEPGRMSAALEHLEAMIDRSRAMWDLILAETDDEREWIPSPEQTGVLPGVEVDAAMVEQWRRFLDEGQALLTGRMLVPFWRPAEGKGVNLRRVFTEPRDFDLVLWVQGTAALPYLEEGPVTDQATWRQFQRVFGGQFIGFAIWFN